MDNYVFVETSPHRRRGDSDCFGSSSGHHFHSVLEPGCLYEELCHVSMEGCVDCKNSQLTKI